MEQEHQNGWERNEETSDHRQRNESGPVEIGKCWIVDPLRLTYVVGYVQVDSCVEKVLPPLAHHVLKSINELIGRASGNVDKGELDACKYCTEPVPNLDLPLVVGDGILKAKEHTPGSCVQAAYHRSQ